MTDALFYELLTTDAITRSRCFSKFPQIENPVRIVGHIHRMLLHEQRTKTKALDFLSYEVKERFRFNLHLRDIGYELPPDAVQNTNEETANIEGRVDRYRERTNTVVSIFPEVTQGSDAARLIALQEYEAAIAIPKNILSFYKSIGDPSLPPYDLLTGEWATFRFFQINLLFSLHALHRHRGPIPATISPREFTRLEHDVHDASLLATAVMAGGLATQE
ncbi:MAG: hypothetical protein ACREGR_00180, partial [Minisyncoccia bacterium]